MNPAIRLATAADLAAINDIYNHYVLTSTCTYQLEPETMEDRRKWFANHGEKHPVTVAEIDGKVIGWGSISRFHARAAYANTVENSLYVHPDHRRQKIGTTLLADQIDRARKIGHHTILAIIDADLPTAVKSTVNGCYLNSGQTCTALTRMLVPASKYDEAAKIAAEVARGFTVGDPLGESTKLGPLSSQAQLERVRTYIKKGVAEGAELVAGGAEPPEGVPQGGYYVRPTVFGRVKNSMTIAQEEIFGPVLAIIPYQDEEEAVRIANDSVYGLAGAVWSKDEARAQRVARRMRAGQIDINGGAFNMNAPFGGFKQSGHGREAGVYGLEEFLEYKSLQLKG